MSDRGSIFIETIVATAILAMILGATFDVLGNAAARSRRAERQRGALLVAQSRLAAFPLAARVSPGIARGNADGYRWQVTIRPLDTQRAAFSAAGLMQVEATVTAGDGRAGRVRLTTVRQGARS